MAQASSFQRPGNAPALIPGSQFPWSNIEETQAYLEKLERLCHRERILRANNYVLEQLTQKQITKKLRCVNCFGRPDKSSHEPTKTNVDPSTSERNGNTNDTNRHGNHKLKTCSYHPGKLEVWRGGSGRTRPQKVWSCCSSRPSEAGCVNRDRHILPEPDNVHILQHYHYHVAPAASGTTIQDSHTKDPRQTSPKAKAIALDCEMGTSMIGEPELIRVTAIDLFTKKTLIDNLVYPSVPMSHFNSRYSGVTGRDMDLARRSKTCYYGRDKAREALWKFVDQNTIVVAHSGHNDLNALRWLHSRVIDTFLLERSLDGKVDGGKSLKNLCEKRLGLAIQNARGHDSLEDALACRELLNWWVLKSP